MEIKCSTTINPTLHGQEYETIADLRSFKKTALIIFDFSTSPLTPVDAAQLQDAKFTISRKKAATRVTRFFR
jgi:hypothetical protein